MHKTHEYNKEQRCIHCGGSRKLIEENKWECSLIDSPKVTGPRKEIKHNFNKLNTLLLSIPCVKSVDCYDEMEDLWSCHIRMDLTHEIVWHLIQGIAFVINDTSITGKLPATFYPTSPPPYLNGGPYNYLHWIIRSESPEFIPDYCCEWFINRFPNNPEFNESWLALDN
jgi:hypothetical protein